MGKWVSKFVNDFQVNDRIRVRGFVGTVTEVFSEERVMERDYKTGEVLKTASCTYLTVHFDEPEVIGFQYQDGSYGGTNNLVSYGYYDDKGGE